MAVKERDHQNNEQNDEYARQVGGRIVRSRKEAGLTQVELAELVGSSQRAMQGYENGERVPYRQMAEIARIVNKPMAWLLHGDQAILDRDQQMSEFSGQMAQFEELLIDLTKAVRDMNKSVKRLVGKLE